MASIIKNFLSKYELTILQKYCYNKLDFHKDWTITSQSFSPAWYHDPFMTALLDVKLPIVSKESKLELLPTYAYWRYYVFGGTLKKHTDRPSCEISVTCCIKKYDNWPIIVEGKKFELKEGDAILYNGLFEKHERPGTYKGEGMAQVFFHYVNKNGLFKHHAYDSVLKNEGIKMTEEDKQNIEKVNKWKRQ
mgnify:CR=1 FL=1